MKPNSRPPNFLGPELKTERAAHHIDELDRIFRSFIKNNTDAIFAKAKKNKWRKKTVTIGGHFPRYTPTVIGDAVHNLRASLDHAYCLLVEANNHSIDRFTHFPFGKDRGSVQGTIKGHIVAGHGPSEKVRDAILNEIQPYVGGKGERLYGLHKLDITDKHEILIPTASRLSLKGFKAVLPNGNSINLSDFNLSSLGPNVQEKGMLTFAAGLRLEAEKGAKALFDIGFQSGQPFEGESIVDTLRDLLGLTRKALTFLQIAA